MITGFNTEIEHQGTVFHVQTEDKGLDNPVIETIIFTAGEILDSKRTSYAELAGSGNYSEDEILQRMENQHQGMIREIINGRFSGDEALPFGHAIMTNRSLDEVVVAFLQEAEAVEAIKLELMDEQALVEGTSSSMTIRVLEEGSDRPLDSAQVTVMVKTTVPPSLGVASSTVLVTVASTSAARSPVISQGVQPVPPTATLQSTGVPIGDSKTAFPVAAGTPGEVWSMT